MSRGGDERRPLAGSPRANAARARARTVSGRQPRAWARVQAFGVGGPRAWVLVGGVVVLIGVGVVGLRSRRYAVVAHGVPGDVAQWTSTVIVAALLVVGVVLFALFLTSLRRRNSDDEPVRPPVPISPWARLITLLIVVAAVGTPIALLILRLRHGRGLTTVGRGLPAPGGPAQGAPSGDAVPVMSGWPWVVLAVVAVVLLVPLLRRRAGAAPVSGPSSARAADDAAPVAAALDAGLGALRGGEDDPRAAVLACYAAMERTLAGTAADPRPADAPMEVVTRACDSGVVAPAAAADAATLTALFRRARYSTHPFGARDRARAQDALERIRGGVRTP